MSNRFVRKSHFRHVFGKQAKKQQTYFDIKLATYGDGDHLAASEKYVIFSTTGGGGPCCVTPFGKVGRIGSSAPKLNVHTSKTTDFAFSEFNPAIVATASEDCMVGVSVLPDDPEKFKGNSDVVSKQTFEGHQKKVDLVRWHPSAAGILGSVSHDGVVKVWDVDEGKEALEFDLDGIASSMSWNEDGSLITCALSNKKTVIFDPRTNKAAFKFKTGFTNGKNQFMTDINLFGVGGSVMGTHEYHLYDLKDTSEPIIETEVDGSAGMLLQYYDRDTKMIYLGSKGGSQIKYFEVENKGGKAAMHKLSLHGMTTGVKGWTFLPKRLCDWKQCMVAQSLMLFRDNITPVDFIVPRKSSLFAKDIYPPAASGEPAHDAGSYLGGEDLPPIVKSMNPKDKGASAGAAAPKVVTKASLIAENKKLKEKIAELEAKLAAK